MNLTPIATVTLQDWYSAALTALNELLSGRRVASASYSQGTGSRSVSYSQADLTQLRQWISELLTELQGRGVMTRTPSRRRAIGFQF
jgi:hypothetical protein